MFQAVDQDRSEPLIRADGQIAAIRTDRAGLNVCAEAERLYMHAACTGTEIAELLQPILQAEPEQGTQIQLVAVDTAERFSLPEQPLDRAVFDLVRGQRPPQTYRRLSQRQLDIRRIRREQGFLLMQLPCAVLIELVFGIKIRIVRPPEQGCAVSNVFRSMAVSSGPSREWLLPVI